MRLILPTKICVALAVVLGFISTLFSQNHTARLDLEQSTDGLSSWQRVPVTLGKLNNGSLSIAIFSNVTSVHNQLNLQVESITSLLDNMIRVEGGILLTSNEFNGEEISTFQIGKYEVTWDEWQEVRDWAVGNGYSDLANAGAGSAGNHPVRGLSWVEVLKWCNAKSEKEGLTPVYLTNGEIYRTGSAFLESSTANILWPKYDTTANGYRLPTEAEWEWAARGGLSSQNYIYSGSNDPNAVGWFWDNSQGALLDQILGRGDWPVGQKEPNELGIYDMSGNVWEICWNLRARFTSYMRGGSWTDGPHTGVVHDIYSISDGVHYVGFRLARTETFHFEPTIQPSSYELERYIAKYDIEQSIDGLKSWQRVPITAEMLKVGGIEMNPVSNSAFYRMKIVATPVEENMVAVTGGTLPKSSSLWMAVVRTFQIGKYEVTWGEWQEVRDWAIQNGYFDLANTGAGSAINHPAHSMNWYEVVKWCNAKSEKEGLTPVYRVNGEVYRTGDFGWDDPPINVNRNANGYRLPTEAEWEWAARGGLSSQGYTYSGSNDVNAVAWYWDNSSGAAVDLHAGRGTWPVGQKEPNELGIYDMDGNVSEFCWDVHEIWRGDRQVRGLSWGAGYPFNYRWSMNIPYGGPSLGFRIARNAP